MQLFTSSQRRVGETTSDFHNDFAPPKKVEGKKLVFRMLQIFNSAFNISSACVLDVSGVPVSLTPGLYSMVDAALMIETRINTVIGPATVAVTADENAAKMTFTFAAPQTLDFLTGASASRVNNIWKVLGFTSLDGLAAVDSPAGLVHTSPYCCTFGLPVTLYIHISIDGNPVSPIEIGGPNLNRSCSLVVPLSTESGSMTRLTQSDITLLIQPPEQFIRSAHFRVTDEAGTLIDLNNSDWWILFDLE